MDRVTSEESAARRARWLAELTGALEDASDLVKALGADEGRFEAAALYARIEAAMLEAQMMRLTSTYAAEPEFDPEWIESLLWRRSA